MKMQRKEKQDNEEVFYAEKAAHCTTFSEKSILFMLFLHIPDGVMRF